MEAHGALCVQFMALCTLPTECPPVFLPCCLPAAFFGVWVCSLLPILLQDLYFSLELAQPYYDFPWL